MIVSASRKNSHFFLKGLSVRLRRIGIVFVLGIFLFFIIYFSRIFLLAGNLPDWDLYISSPSTMASGNIQEIAVYVFEKDSFTPVSGCRMEVALIAPPPSRKIILQVPVLESSSGQYSSKFLIPADIVEGEYSLGVFYPTNTSIPLSMIPIKIEPTDLFCVDPPEMPVYLGDTLVFKIAATDANLEKGLYRLPIRCKMYTPEGLESVNRVVSTLSDGTTYFRCLIHPQGSKGIYKFVFSAGKRIFNFEIPILNEIPTQTRFWNFFKNFSAQIGKSFFSGRIFSKSSPLKTWFLKPEKKRKNSILWTKLVDDRISIGVSESTSKFRMIEVWNKNRLYFRQSLGVASGVLTIAPDNQGSLEKRFPILIKLWQKEESGVAVNYLLIPRLPTNTAWSDIFINFTNKCVPLSNKSLSRILSMSRGNCHFKQVKAFTILLSNSLNWSLDFILICSTLLLIMELVLTFTAKKLEISLNGPNNLSIKTYPVICMFLYVLFFGGYQFFANAENALSLCSATGFAVLAFLWFMSPSLKSARRLSESFILIITMIGFIFLAGYVYSSHNIKFPLAESLSFFNLTFIILSFILFLLIGILHLNEPRSDSNENGIYDIPRIFYSIIGKNLKEVSFQILLLMIFSIFIIWLPKRISAPSVSILSPQQQPAVIRQNTPLIDKPFIYDFQPLEMMNSSLLKDKQNSSSAVELDVSNAYYSTVTSPKPRFFLLERSKNWNGRKIQKIRLFLNSRDFWDRNIQVLQGLKPNINSQCMEAIARLERFEFLDTEKQIGETLVIESLFSVIAHSIITLINKRQCLHPNLRILFTELIKKGRRIISIDPTIIVSNRSFQNDTPDPKRTLKENEFTPPLLESETSSEPIILSRGKFLESFKSGGKLVMSGPSGNLLFPLRSETLTLTRGTSFPEDFEIRKIDVHRDFPAILEIDF